MEKSYILIGDIYRFLRERGIDSRLRRAAKKIIEMVNSGKFVMIDLTDEARA